jgi:hypothetical protein
VIPFSGILSWWRIRISRPLLRFISSWVSSGTSLWRPYLTDVRGNRPHSIRSKIDRRASILEYAYERVMEVRALVVLRGLLH